MIFMMNFITTSQIVFHGISVDQKIIDLDGSEAPVRVVARSLLASERLVPVATLNKVSIESIEACCKLLSFAHIFDLYGLQVKTPYRPVESNLCSLPPSRDRLPSGKQIIALTLT